MQTNTSVKLENGNEVPFCYYTSNEDCNKEAIENNLTYLYCQTKDGWIRDLFNVTNNHLMENIAKNNMKQFLEGFSNFA